jgi:succinate-semialdehyde dehydrogenase/glutarate-semialdehyde dehydrogenase
MSIATINPATGETLQTFSPHDAGEIERRIARAVATFHQYRWTSLEQRGGWLNAAADILEEDRERWARIITVEMGKLIQSARDEVTKCAAACRYYASHAADFLREERVELKTGEGIVRYEPIGPVLAIMPWNFPFWQVIRFAAPALMAGNVGLLKHASNVPQCALALEEIFRRAGFPDGALQTLLVPGEAMEPIIADERIRAVTLTGSEGAGSRVAEAAGRAIKKTVLELGGSDPFIIMPSADFGKAIATAVQARLICNGQSCIAAKRFIVHESIAARFTSELVARMEALRAGDPLDEATQIGPLALPQVRDDLDRQVAETVRAGGKLLTGGKKSPGPGWYYAPTVVADPPRGSPAACEELFGPVAVVFTVEGIDAAIALANDTRFGLGAAVWTNEESEIERFAAELETGQVFVNSLVASDPALPFGGVKRSGYGRELSVHGLREFVNVKTVFRAAVPRPSRAE